MTDNIYNVDLAISSDKKIMYEFAMELSFNEDALGNRSNRETFFFRLLKSPAILVSGISVFILPENLDEFLERIKLLFQEKEAGKKSIII